MEPFQLQLNILTLNLWGIPYISKDRDTRMQAIGLELVKGLYDIVAFQEVWSKNDYNYLKAIAQHRLPYSHYFHSGVLGSGLCILSKYPIIATFFHSWSVNGYFHRIQHGDWFGGKGVGLCKLLINDKIVNVYNVHLHAEYDRKNDEYMTHRIIQAFDTAQFIELTKGDSILQIVAGDLNTEPDDLAAKLLTSNFDDTYDIKYGEIHTHDCKTNSYTDNNNVLTKGKRIDYILHSAGNNYMSTVMEYALPLSNRINGFDMSYSDHEAVYAKLLITNQEPKIILSISDDDRKIKKESSRLRDDDDDDDDFYRLSDPIRFKRIQNKRIEMVALEKSIEICNESLEKLHSNKKFYFTLAFSLTIILLYLIDFIAPYGLKTIYLFIKIVLSGLILYFVFMGTLWNYIEYNGILSCKLAMVTKLYYHKLIGY